MRISDWSSYVCSSDLSQGYVDDDKGGRDEGHFAAEEPEPAINVASEDFEKMVDDAGVAHSSACFRWLELLRGPAGRARQSPRAAWGRTKEAPTARSEESRVGKGCVSTCRSRWSSFRKKKKKKESISVGK